MAFPLIKTRLSFLPICFGLILTISACQEESEELELSTGLVDFFNCRTHRYFQDTDFPVITAQDSVRLEGYSERYHELANRYSYFSARPHVFLSHIHNRIDTTELQRLMKDRKTFEFKSLEYSDVYSVMKYDAVIYGRVIDKRKPRDTIQCLHFKTEYVVEVLEVINSYFPLKKGDKVLIKDIMGFAGGCIENNGDTQYSTFSHVKEYVIGDESTFALDRSWYQIFFIYKSRAEHYKRYNDVYCPQAFRIPLGNNNYYNTVKDRLDDLKLYFNNKHLPK